MVLGGLVLIGVMDGAGGRRFGPVSPERTQLPLSGFLYRFRIDEAL